MSHHPASVLLDAEYEALTSAIWGWHDGHAGVYDMTPAPPAGRFHPCTRCGMDIEPDEPFHRSKVGAVSWCDGCMVEEESEL